MEDLALPTADQIRATDGADVLARSFAQLYDAIKGGKIGDSDAATQLARLDGEVRALREAASVGAIDRAIGNDEAEMRAFVAESGKIVLRGDLGAGKDGKDSPAGYSGGLLDSAPTCEWHARFLDLVEARTIATMGRPGDHGNKAAPAQTPVIDGLIRRHIATAPSFIRKGFEGTVERLFSGASGAGSEWQATLVLPRVEETLKVIAELGAYFQTVDMPTKTISWPFMSTGLRPYLKGAATMDNPAYYTGSTPDTTARSFTSTGMAVLTQILDDADEDSILAALPFLRLQLAEAIRDGEEDAILNGDTAATHQDTIASWNIRGRWGASGLGGSMDHRRAWIGLRARAEDIGATAKLDGTSYTALTGASGLLAAAEIKLHAGSMNSQGLVYACSPEHYVKIIKGDTSVLTLDKYGAGASIMNGEVGKVMNTRIHRTQYLSADLNTSGIFDNATTTKTAAVLVDARRFARFRRRGLMLEADKDIRNGVTYLVSTMRGTFGTVDASTTVNEVYVYNLAKS